MRRERMNGWASTAGVEMKADTCGAVLPSAEARRQQLDVSVQETSEFFKNSEVSYSKSL